MAMALPPDGVARERKEESGRALGECRCRGIYDDAIDLTSGANAGVRAPNGSQVSRWATTTASSALNQTMRSPTDRVTSTMIIFQTKAS